MLIFDKKSGIHYIFYILLFWIVSCVSQNEPDDGFEIIQLEITGEGGEEVVDLESAGWRVVSIESKEGGHRIMGDTFDLDGELLLENRPLELDGLGYLVSSLNVVGFEIRHETSGVLGIELKENASGKPYGFVIILQNVNNFRKIYVDQAESAGYDFESIEFFVSEDYEDSIYMRHNLHRYEFDLLEARQLEVSPFAGPNVFINSYFESEDMNAFVWFANDSIEVELPSKINDGNIYFSGKRSIYGKPSSVPYLPNILVTINAPAGRSIFSTNIEMRKRVASYKLTIKSRSTSEIKVIEGEWIESSPTGAYRIDEIKED